LLWLYWHYSARLEHSHHGLQTTRQEAAAAARLAVLQLLLSWAYHQHRKQVNLISSLLNVLRQVSTVSYIIQWLDAVFMTMQHMAAWQLETAVKQPSKRNLSSNCMPTCN
jgi:hypothetical protein